MTQPDVSRNPEPTARYEIRLQGVAPEALRIEFPTATVHTTRTETVLFPRVERPAELDDLIDQLLSRGFVLTEVHKLKAPRTMSFAQPSSGSSEKGQSDDDDL